MANDTSNVLRLADYRGKPRTVRPAIKRPKTPEQRPAYEPFAEPAVRVGDVVDPLGLISGRGDRPSNLFVGEAADVRYFSAIDFIRAVRLEDSRVFITFSLIQRDARGQTVNTPPYHWYASLLCTISSAESGWHVSAAIAEVADDVTRTHGRYVTLMSHPVPGLDRIDDRHHPYAVVRLVARESLIHVEAPQPLYELLGGRDDYY